MYRKLKLKEWYIINNTYTYLPDNNSNNMYFFYTKWIKFKVFQIDIVFVVNYAKISIPKHPPDRKDTGNTTDCRQLYRWTDYFFLIFFSEILLGNLHICSRDLL